MDQLRVGAREPVLVLPRGGGKSLNLKAGDVVRAQVVKVLSGGELSLRIGGALVQARTATPLPLGAGVLFRVLGQEGGEGETGFKLQFLQVADSPETAQTTPSGSVGGGSIPPSDAGSGPVTDTVRNLARELAARAPLKNRQDAGLATTIRQLLKSLPDDPATLPRELRHQLLGLLQSSLRETEQSIQKRALLLFGEASIQDLADQVDLPDHPELSRLLRARLPLFAEAGKILQLPIQSILRDTGVSLEAKLKALAQALLAEESSTPDGALQAGWQKGAYPEADPLGTDLKARLLQMRQLILEPESMGADTREPSRVPAGMGAGGTRGEIDKFLPVVDGLLRDIETFQLLSKLTTSFYTFLPFLWKGLREGDIAFKRGRGGAAAQIHYCVVNLDFDRLGRVTIVAMMQGGDFFLSFKTDREELRSALDGSVRELQEMFRSEGLSLKEVSFFAKDDPQLAPFENLESFESILNLKI